MMNKKEIENATKMFRAVAPEATIHIQEESPRNKPGDKGYISHTLGGVVKRVFIYNAKWSTGQDFGYKHHDGSEVTESKDIIQVVAHELGHIIQIELGHANKYTYAFNEVTTEYVSLMLMGKSIDDIASYRYIQGWMKDVRESLKPKLAKAICEMYPIVKKWMTDYNLV